MEAETGRISPIVSLKKLTILICKHNIPKAGGKEHPET